jgi:hypothetical protein
VPDEFPMMVFPVPVLFILAPAATKDNKPEFATSIDEFPFPESVTVDPVRVITLPLLLPILVVPPPDVLIFVAPTILSGLAFEYVKPPEFLLIMMHGDPTCVAELTIETDEIDPLPVSKLLQLPRSVGDAPCFKYRTIPDVVAMQRLKV